jgi:hypothetical protein
MAQPIPSIFFGGLRLLFANKRTLLWSYLVLLVAGLVNGASVGARISDFLDHSLAAQKIAGDIDAGYYAELVLHANEHNPGSAPVTSALTFISILFTYFLTAGILYVFLTSERPRLATIVGAGIQYFWRFFRLTLFALIIGGPILGVLFWLRFLYLTSADEKYVEAAYDIRAGLTLIVILFVAILLRLWFDLAEVVVVQLGINGDRRVRRSLGPSLRLLFKYFFRVFFSYFVAGTLGVLAFAAFVYIYVVSQPSHLILPVFLWSQLALLCLLASRIWQRGILASLVLSTTEQTVILVQPGPPDPYPLTPIPDRPETNPELGPEPEPGIPILPVPPLPEPAS